jgi:dihydrofolate reductase
VRSSLTRAHLGTRKLIVTQNITLDGVIDAAGWFSPGDDTDELAEVASVLRAQSAAADALLLGRTSFEEMRGFWPDSCPYGLSTRGLATKVPL